MISDITTTHDMGAAGRSWMGGNLLVTVLILMIYFMIILMSTVSLNKKA